MQSDSTNNNVFYKIDPHVHTSESSPCGKVRAREQVQLYKRAGFDVVVITDHFKSTLFKNMEDEPWEAKVDKFLEGYNAAKDEGEKCDLAVILGMEIAFVDENPNDYLVFGFDKEFLLNYPDLYNTGIKEFKKIADNNNLLVYQAHPFRNKQRPLGCNHVHGCEVHNGNPRHNARNELAYFHAKHNSLMMISGSDSHQPQDVGRGGIISSRMVYNSAEFVNLLKETGTGSSVYPKPSDAPVLQIIFGI